MLFIYIFVISFLISVIVLFLCIGGTIDIFQPDEIKEIKSQINVTNSNWEIESIWAIESKRGWWHIYIDLYQYTYNRNALATFQYNIDTDDICCASTIASKYLNLREIDRTYTIE